jgi:hypothetical protein
MRSMKVRMKSAVIVSIQTLGRRALFLEFLRFAAFFAAVARG